MEKQSFVSRPDRYSLKSKDKNSCRITRIDGKSLGVYHGHIINLSSTGLLLKLSNNIVNFNLGDKLLIEFEIPFVKNEILLELEVKRTLTLDDSFFLGLHFLSPNPFVQDRIEFGVKESLAKAI